MTDRELYYNIYLFGNDLIEYQENETGKIVDRLINTWCEADPNTIEETKIRLITLSLSRGIWRIIKSIWKKPKNILTCIYLADLQHISV